MESHYEKFFRLCEILTEQMDSLLGRIKDKRFRYHEDNSPLSLDETIRDFEEYIEGWTQSDFHTDGLFKELLGVDHIARQAIVKLCSKNLNVEFVADWIKHYDVLCGKVDDYYINRSLFLFLSLYGTLYDTASLFGINMTDVYSLRCVENFIEEQGYNRRYYFPKELVDTIPQDVNDKKYKTLPRTHRIAAVKELIRKSGLCRNVDDTKISAFVEAVTGGNIEAKAKNTQSYKTPTKDAQNAADELLKKIGIE